VVDLDSGGRRPVVRSRLLGGPLAAAVVQGGVAVVRAPSGRHGDTGALCFFFWLFSLPAVPIALLYLGLALLVAHLNGLMDSWFRVTGTD
jgi:hypothetical protein